MGYGLPVRRVCQRVPRYREPLPGMIKGDGRLDVAVYYRDTWVTDFRLYQGIERLRGIVDMIETARVPEDHPLLTHYELDEWRKVTVAAYRGECPRAGEPEFVTEDYVKAFVADAPELIERTWERAGNRQQD